MRVTHVIASSRGGGAVHASALARFQASIGHAVQLVVPEEGELDRGALRSAGVDMPDIGPSGPAWIFSLGRLLCAGDSRPELVHAHGARAALWARLAVAGRWPRRPAVLYAFHGLTAPYLPHGARMTRRVGEAALAPLTTGYVCVCEAEREEARRFGLPLERLHVIHNGVDSGRFDPAARGAADEQGRTSASEGAIGRASARESARTLARVQIRAELGFHDDAFLLLSAGRLDRPRDPGLILGALGRAASEHPRLGLLFAGEGPMRARAEALVRRLGLGDRVRFLGFRRDLPALLGGVDALVHVTSAWEGFPYAVLEAMAAGLPVLASRAGGIPEAVVEGETGLLVPLGHEGALGAAIGRLASDPGWARRLGEAGQARVRALFTETRMCEAHEALYARILARH